MCVETRGAGSDLRTEAFLAPGGTDFTHINKPDALQVGAPIRIMPHAAGRACIVLGFGFERNAIVFRTVGRRAEIVRDYATRRHQLQHFKPAAFAAAPRGMKALSNKIFPFLGLTQPIFAAHSTSSLTFR